MYAPAKQRAEELHNLLNDTDVNYISFAKGGSHQEEILAHIDWDIVKKESKMDAGIFR